jgi:hypothetical protein
MLNVVDIYDNDNKKRRRKRMKEFIISSSIYENHFDVIFLFIKYKNIMSIQSNLRLEDIENNNKNCFDSNLIKF